MPEPYLKIGDVAKKVGVSPSVIRSWESLGLARPRRTESKYRLYTADDVKLLKRARFLRKVRGLNAAAIVQLLKREGKVRPVADGNAGAIGGHLRQLRARRQLSLAQVAHAVGVSVGFLSALERSQMSGSVGTLRKLARFYKTNILDFYDAHGTASRQVRPAERKVLEAGAGVRMELLAWGNTVMEPHLFRIAPDAGSGDTALIHDRILANFLKHISAEANGLSTAITIYARANDPKKAQSIAEGLAQAYVDDQVAAKVPAAIKSKL